MPLPINELVQRDLRVVGSLYGSSNTVVQIPRLLELHAAGRLDLSRIPGPEYRLDEINEAYARLPSQSVGRGLIFIGPRWLPSRAELGARPPHNRAFAVHSFPKVFGVPRLSISTIGPGWTR